jgi:hypothetical protein
VMGLPDGSAPAVPLSPKRPDTLSRSRPVPTRPTTGVPPLPSRLPPPLPVSDSSDATSSAVHIDSVAPSRLRLTRGNVSEVDLFGRGFADSMNVVLLDGIELATRPGAGGVVRFAMPSALPSHSEVAPRQLTAGPHELRVRNAAGTSNAVRLIVETSP